MFSFRATFWHRRDFIQNIIRIRNNNDFIFKSCYDIKYLPCNLSTYDIYFVTQFKFYILEIYRSLYI